MKKTILIILLLLFIIIVSVYILRLKTKVRYININKYNSEYETYLNRNIKGTELATLINKAINENEKNNVKKDKDKHYIADDEKSINIEIKILFTDKTYPMEEIYKNDTSEFIKYFDLIEFKCTKTEYHEKTGKISKMMFEQIENE